MTPEPYEKPPPTFKAYVGYALHIVFVQGGLITGFTFFSLNLFPHGMPWSEVLWVLFFGPLVFLVAAIFASTSVISHPLSPKKGAKLLRILLIAAAILTCVFVKESTTGWTLLVAMTPGFWATYNYKIIEKTARQGAAHARHA